MSIEKGYMYEESWTPEARQALENVEAQTEAHHQRLLDPAVRAPMEEALRVRKVVEEQRETAIGADDHNYTTKAIGVFQRAGFSGRELLELAETIATWVEKGKG